MQISCGKSADIFRKGCRQVWWLKSLGVLEIVGNISRHVCSYVKEIQ